MACWITTWFIVQLPVRTEARRAGAGLFHQVLSLPPRSLHFSNSVELVLLYSQSRVSPLKEGGGLVGGIGYLGTSSSPWALT